MVSSPTTLGRVPIGRSGAIVARSAHTTGHETRLARRRGAVDGPTTRRAGVGVCGACTIFQDDQLTRPCIVPMADVEGSTITTIEGIAVDDVLHPVQQAWIDEDVAQCGYCQAGQIMTAIKLLESNPDPSDKDIDEAMSDNICRCGTYFRIRQAIKRAAAG